MERLVFVCVFDICDYVSIVGSPLFCSRAQLLRFHGSRSYFVLDSIDNKAKKRNLMCVDRLKSISKFSQLVHFEGDTLHFTVLFQIFITGNSYILGMSEIWWNLWNNYRWILFRVPGLSNLWHYLVQMGNNTNSLFAKPTNKRLANRKEAENFKIATSLIKKWVKSWMQEHKSNWKRQCVLNILYFNFSKLFDTYISEKCWNTSIA